MTNSYASDFMQYCQGGNNLNVSSKQLLYDYLSFINDEYQQFNDSCDLT